MHWALWTIAPVTFVCASVVLLMIEPNETVLAEVVPVIPTRYTGDGIEMIVVKHYRNGLFSSRPSKNDFAHVLSRHHHEPIPLQHSGVLECLEVVVAIPINRDKEIVTGELRKNQCPCCTTLEINIPLHTFGESGRSYGVSSQPDLSGPVPRDALHV